MGIPTPRLFTPPLMPLTRENTRGFNCIEFAKLIGQPFLPWQEEVVKRALELRPDGRYRFRVVLVLVARQNGKSRMLQTVALWKMYVDNVKLVLGAAQDLKAAKEVWQQAIETAKSTDELKDEVASVRWTNGEQCLTLTNGARYMITAATRSAGRGLSVDFLCLDELREHRDDLAWSALSKTLQARPNGQIWGFSSAGDDQSTVLNRLRQQALSGDDESIGIFEWSAPEGCDLDDPASWCAANPGLGLTIDEQAVRTSLSTDTPATFRTEVLNQRVSQIDEAIDVSAWMDCGDAQATMESVRTRVVVGVDVSLDGQHITAVAAANSPTGVRIEVVGDWSSTGAARAELPALLERIKPRSTVWFPGGPAAALGSMLRAHRPIEISGAKVAECCQTLADLVVNRRLRHNLDPLLTSQVGQATKMPVSDGWRFARRGGVGHIDAVYATAGAVWVAASQPIVREPRIMVFTGQA